MYLSKTTRNTPPPELDTFAKDKPVSFTAKTSTSRIVITFAFTVTTILIVCFQPAIAAEPYIGGNFFSINIDEIARLLRDTDQDHRTVNSSDVNTAAAAADVQRSVPYYQLVISNQPISSENPKLIDGHAINNDVTEITEQSAVNTSTSERGLLVISEQRVSNSSGSTISDISSSYPSPTGSTIYRYHEPFSRSAGVSVLPNGVSKPILSEERHQQIDQRHQTLISGTRESTALQLYGSDHQYSENIESPIEDTTNSPDIMVITGQTRATDDRDTIYRVLGQRRQARTAVTLYHPTEENDGENGNHGALVVTERYRQPLRPAVGHQLLVTPRNPGTDPRCPINQPARLAAIAVSGRSQLSNPVISPVSSDIVLAANTNDTAVRQDNGSDIDI